MKLILAPMHGLADAVMRDLLTRIGGYDGCVSEFVRITHTLHSRATWLKHMPEIAAGCRTPSGVRCTVQLLGSDENMMAANALQAVRFGADEIDLNFGCPAPTVNKHMGGAVLLKEPQKIGRIVRTLRDALPAHIPLTAKMRLGYEDDTLAPDNARAIADGGAAALTVHARTKVQGYRPPAHWHKIREIAAAVPIPVTANGDIFDLPGYIAAKEATGCRSFMLGRGAVMRPDLARQIRQYEAGETVSPLTFAQIMPHIRLFFRLCRAHEPANSRYALARLKQWLGMLKDAYPEAAALFALIRPLDTADAVDTALEGFCV